MDTSISDSGFGAWVSLLNRAAHTYFARVFKPLGLGPGLPAYLVVLRPGEEVSQDEISRRMMMDKANVARSVGTLCDQGYLTRRRSADDRRSWMVSLTSDGTNMQHEVEHHMRRWVGELRGPMENEEWDTFVRNMHVVATRAMRFATGAAP